MKPETLESRILKRIERKRGDAFVREDFGDLGGYDQVGRVLRKIVRGVNWCAWGRGFASGPAGRSQAASRYRREGLRP
jgi:hypothetical protein